MQVPKKINTPRPKSSLQIGLANEVRKNRMLMGITQEELAWRAKMHRSYLADIERGVRNISLRSLSNLALAIGVPVMSLLSESTEGEVLAELTQFNQGRVDLLLVEDDPQDVELTLRAFRKSKFTNKIDVVRDGAEAVDYLFYAGQYANRAGGQPQLVLLDLMLPKVSGLEVLRKMKAQPETKDISVVVLTTVRDEKSILLCRQLGVAHYISKPVNFDNFAKVTSRMKFKWTLTDSSVSEAPKFAS